MNDYPNLVDVSFVDSVIIEWLTSSVRSELQVGAIAFGIGLVIYGIWAFVVKKH
jgi:hypothetical protein